jgi:hypothetical protein
MDPISQERDSSGPLHRAGRLPDHHRRQDLRTKLGKNIRVHSSQGTLANSLKVLLKRISKKRLTVWFMI